MDSGTEVFRDECGVCAKPLNHRQGQLMMVRDSSMVHPSQPRMDGQRLVLACCDEHMAELRERYRRRPFIETELWAGKIRRALSGRPGGLTGDELARATGLNTQQITQAQAWQSAQTGSADSAVSG